MARGHSFGLSITTGQLHCRPTSRSDVRTYSCIIVSGGFTNERRRHIVTGLKACYEDQAYLANLTKLKQDIRAEVGRVTNVFFEKQRLDTSISDTSVADEKTALYYSYTKDRQSSPLSQSLFLIIAHTFGDARIPIDRRPASGIFWRIVDLPKGRDLRKGTSS